MKIIAMPSRFCKSAKQVQHFRLNGYVERRRRLVGDQKLGLVGNRHGDHHPLALAAGKLVWIGVKPPLGFGDFYQMSKDPAPAPPPPFPKHRGGGGWVQ